MKGQQRCAAVIYNPIKVDLSALREAVALEEKTNGWSETLWWETSKDDPGEEVARRAVDLSLDLGA